MITIKQLTKQEYDNIGEIPNRYISFFENEVDICKIISLQFAKNIKQNIDILKMFLHHKDAEVIEVKTDQKVLYLVKTSV